MKPSDTFFSGNRFAIFGAKALGRMQGDVLIAALNKAGKKPVAIESESAAVKGAEVCQTLADAGQVDGVVILPPAPWDDESVRFTSDAVNQCKAQGITNIWIYTAGDPSESVKIAEKEGFDPVAGHCPCLYINGSGFPHNFHQFISKLLKQY
ncbi:MAG: CoA-binding protein [Armatimonadota bacterium]